jgi:hypothetical protein
MFCSQCGEKNPDDSKFCSKCGAALVAAAEPAPAAAYTPPPSAAAGGKRTSGMSIAALILGILGIISFWPLSILAIIFGAIGISQINKDPSLKGKGMAMAGLVMGIVAIAVWILVAVVWWGTLFWFL